MTDGAVGSFAALSVDEPYAGVRRRSFDAQGATVTSYEFAPGARFPRHRHGQEQITLVETGSLTMEIAGVPQQLSSGGWSVVPGGVEHGIVAGPEGARITAIVVPRRTAADAYEVVA